MYDKFEELPTAGIKVIVVDCLVTAEHRFGWAIIN